MVKLRSALTATLLPTVVLLGQQIGHCADWSEPPFSIPLQMDAGGQPLNGAADRYTITFAADELPPAREWSLALYDLPQQRLVTNSINRYSIDSRILPNLVRGESGSVTIYIQDEPPRGSRAKNWLPAADGPFMMVLHLDGPEKQALDGAWEAPPVVRVE